MQDFRKITVKYAQITDCMHFILYIHPQEFATQKNDRPARAIVFFNPW